MLNFIAEDLSAGLSNVLFLLFSGRKDLMPLTDLFLHKIMCTSNLNDTGKQNLFAHFIITFQLITSPPKVQHKELSLLLGGRQDQFHFKLV